MAVKFSQFSSASPTATTFLVGYDGAVNIKVPYSSLVGGSGTVNYLSKWTSSSALGNSLVYDDGTNVGIGTTSPTSKLHINGGTLNVIGSGTSVNEFRSNGIIAIDMTPNLTDDYKFRTLVAVSGDVTQTAINNISINSGGYFGFGGGGSEKMRLTSAGRLLIGTQTESTYLLDVSGTFRSTGDANINGLTVGMGGGSVTTNTAFGYQAINGSATGTANAALGYQSLQNLTSGPRNVGLGYRVLRSITTGQNNTGVGSNYIGDGSSPLFSVTTGSYNTALGSGALYSASTTSENTAVGYGALGLTTASFVTAVGSSAGYNSTGNGGIFVGRLAGSDVTTGTYNTIIGSGTTGNGITTGSFNTIIGSQITGLSASLSNTIILADGQGNQRLYINNSGNVGIGTTSISAGYRLEVAGSTIIGRSNATAILQIRPNNGYGGWIQITEDVQGDRWSFGVANNSGTLRFGTGSVASNTARVEFFSNGNVGIGVSGTDSGYRLDVNGTARINGIEIGNINSLQQFRGNLAAGVYVTNTHASGPIYVSQANWSLGVLNTQVIISNNSSALQRLTLTDQGINTSNGYGYNWGLNIGADGTSVMQIFTGGNVLFQKSVTKTSTNQASALVEMVSTTQGFLPPRMTNAQMTAIATPASGLMVYDTTNNKLNYYNGTAWVAL